VVCLKGSEEKSRIEGVGSKKEDKPAFAPRKVQGGGGGKWKRICGAAAFF